MFTVPEAFSFHFLWSYHSIFAESTYLFSCVGIGVLGLLMRLCQRLLAALFQFAKCSILSTLCPARWQVARFRIHPASTEATKTRRSTQKLSVGEPGRQKPGDLSEEPSQRYGGLDRVQKHKVS